MPLSKQTRAWLRSIVASIVSGGAGGVVTAFAAIGIFPDKFNMAAGFGDTMKLAGLSCLLHAILGLAMLLQKSPMPAPEPDAPASTQAVQ